MTGTAPTNSNFDTGVEDQPNRPATLVGQNIPPDGGFGKDPVYRNGKFIGYGNGAANFPFPPNDLNKRTFNTPVLVEAADTGPFFHDNSITTNAFQPGGASCFKPVFINTQHLIGHIYDCTTNATQNEVTGGTIGAITARESEVRRPVRLFERVVTQAPANEMP